MFNVGDKIVYPMHGAGRIDAIEEKNILGENQSYYILKMPGEVKVMVPVDKAEQIGVRSVIDKEEAVKVMAVLEENETEMSDKWNKRYRDNMLFIVGINFGLRASDLRALRFSNIINDNFTFKDSFAVFEKKTRNTRKKKKNRYITINEAVMDAVTLYLQNTPNVSLSDYMFRSLSNRGGNKNEPLSIKSIDRILKGIADDLSLNVKMSTHTLRKTFCYWMMMYGHNEPRRLLLLQKMLNHSSPIQTLDYIGLTQEEFDKAYRSLNLGKPGTHRLVDSYIFESDNCLLG